MAITIWDIVNDISHKKQKILDEENKKEYNAWIINRHFSYFIDTLAYAEAMNRFADLPTEMQYDYLFHTIRMRKRFTKWEKKEKLENLELVKEYFQYSDRKAREALKILSDDDIRLIRTKMYTGGVQ